MGVHKTKILSHMLWPLGVYGSQPFTLKIVLIGSVGTPLNSLLLLLLYYFLNVSSPAIALLKKH